jgi:hypothetical protein
MTISQEPIMDRFAGTTGSNLFLAHPAPAGGAALTEILWASAVGVVLVAGLLLFGWAHRSGRTRLLTRLGSFAANVTGLPSWSALPAGIAGGALIIAATGFYWDVASHIDNGRDPGPFANPSHYLIIVGLLGIAVAGYAGVLLGSDAENPSAIRLRPGWRVPLGALLLLVCGTIAVAGFPLDDVWHRIFGQDVTLWGPTHIQMVGGAALSTLALWILVVEGIRSRGEVEASAERRIRLIEASVAGSFLTGLSALQAEFDYSVPQFRLLFHPILLALAAGIALVAARIRLGRGGALKAVAFFLILRGALSLLVGPGLDHTTLHFPLYVGEALLVELVALRVAPARQLMFGALCGIAIGSIGVALEWLWSHAFMTMSWSTELWPEVLLALLAGIAGGLIGGYIGRAFSPTPGERSPRWLSVATALAVVVCLTYPLPISGLQGSAQLTLDTPEASTSRVTVALDPPALANDALWFNVTAWQGGGSVIAPLRELGEGRYRSGPVPIESDWKSLIRLHTGSAIVAVPVYLPRDAAIPAAEVPAQREVVRQFVPDKQILLREAKEIPPWFSWVGNGALALIAIVWMALVTWGLHRMDPTLPDRVSYPSRRLAALQKGS